MFSTLPKLTTRAAKARLFGQQAKVIWFTGLSGAGKTTLANALEQMLCEEGYLCTILDGDALRNGINSNLGFSVEDRFENSRRVAEVAKLFVQNGIISIVATICPHELMRKNAREIIGENDFIEVYINASLDTCEKRDPKGLYQKARNGVIKNFTGISDIYEPPSSQNTFEIQTDLMNLEQAKEKLFHYILPQILPLNKKRPAKPFNFH
ncbi:adenylyl-sulfate kinase [Runella sp.]|uniref:adenylyl-sulfate kinase n=1 Tax=Runella sp. TaxID=1960881 RepID=UPI003D134267